MFVGPFDGRKKRSRCQACSTSHLKVTYTLLLFDLSILFNANPCVIQCSGQAPCTNCERRHVACIFGSTTQRKSSNIILLERGEQKTPATFKSYLGTRKKQSPSSSGSSLVSSPSRLTDNALSFLYYFDVFARRNNFTGKQHLFSDEMKQLSGLHSHAYLMDAMLSIGAIQAVKLNACDAPPRNECLTTALEHYSKSIIGLRDAINSPHKRDDDRQNTVLWTTLLLGLFEVRTYSPSICQFALIKIN